MSTHICVSGHTIYNLSLSHTHAHTLILRRSTTENTHTLSVMAAEQSAT